MGFIKAFIYRNDDNHCNGCGKQLSEIECEKCERKVWKDLNNEEYRRK